MIKDNIDFDYAINKIITDSKVEITKQEDTLNSEYMNNTFENIEKNLNELYEKTRYLENCIQYAKVFLDTKTREFNTEMDAIIKELENLNDMPKNLAYLTYNIPLKQNIVSITDREQGKDKLNPLILKDKKLTLGYELDTNVDFSSVKAISDSVPYDSTLKNIVKNKNYKAIFLEEKVIQNGLTQTMVVYFSTPKVINTLDFVSSNCKIKNIRFGLINGVEEYVNDYSINVMNNSRTCIYVKFDLVCTNYNIVTYEIDKEKVTDNLWNDLKAFESAKITELDKISKLNAEYIISRASQKEEKEVYRHKAKNTMTVQMYVYAFGLDKLEFKYIEKLNEGYFISDYISVGSFTEKEYLTLEVSHFKSENCSIEYSILDGEREIPLLPSCDSMAEHELIFSTVETRFLRSESSSDELIKKDGQTVNISYNDAKNMNDGRYCITYKPNKKCYEYTPINKEVRVKCYIRTYGTLIKDIPYIDSISIRKFGEETLWINKY